MSRGAEKQAKQTFNQSSALTGDASSKTDNLFNNLKQTYEGEISNPQGFDPTDLTAMNTASRQSEGGSIAGAVGEGNRMAARTRNSGGFAPALDESVRAGMRQGSADALKTQEENAMMKEGHRQQGISGEAGLYGTENNDVLSSLGLQNQSTDSLIKAGQSGWFQNMLGFMNAASSAAGGAAALGAKVPCWVAAELYGGWDSYKTRLLRHWIFDLWKTPFGRVFAWVYQRTGHIVAKIIKKNFFARAIVKCIFDRLLKKAERELK